MLLNNYHGDNNNDAIVAVVSWWWTDLSSLQQGLLVSAILLGALIGSHALMWISHLIGQPQLFHAIRACYLAQVWVCGTPCWSYRLSCHSWHGQGRCHLAKMVPAEIHGTAVSFEETVIVGGIVVGYAVRNALSSDPTKWA